jgi:hypothetical protein
VKQLDNPYSPDYGLPIPTIISPNIRNVYEKLLQYDIIGVEDSQFFKDNLDILQKLANSGKRIVVITDE